MSEFLSTVVRPPRHRQVFCNRTLNLRAIRAVGYDMDYTLIHYRVEVWERHAYEYAKRKLLALGWPVEQLQFDPQMMIRGLVLDIQLGNVLKVNSFGYVKQALHGTTILDFETQRRIYSRTVITLSERRYVFLNTLFSLSEACLYAQVVDLLDQRRLPEPLGYADIYAHIRNIIDETHVEGHLKNEIMADPEKFVEIDAEMPLALLDQRQAGKKLLLITNSEWYYTASIMAYVFDRFLPKGMTWRQLFDVVIVSARKPDFFSTQSPLFQVVNDEGLLKPARSMKDGNVYLGGDATTVEAYLGVTGDQILYVGDHIYGDVHVSKSMLRWRTALVLRELENDLAAIEEFAPQQNDLSKLMEKKEEIEFLSCQLRLMHQRIKVGNPGPHSEEYLMQEMHKLRSDMAVIDEKVIPLAEAAGRINNLRWGLLMRAGNDKSHLARQVERHADIYMSRVSNFVYLSPFVYLRSRRGSLPHDPA